MESAAPNNLYHAVLLVLISQSFIVLLSNNMVSVFPSEENATLLIDSVSLKVARWSPVSAFQNVTFRSNEVLARTVPSEESQAGFGYFRVSL